MYFSYSISYSTVTPLANQPTRRERLWVGAASHCPQADPTMALRRLALPFAPLRGRLHSSASTVRIAMVGCGKMAEALADGLQTTFPKVEVHAFDLNESRTELFRSRFGAVVHSSASEAVRGADLLLLACKPQNIEAVGKELAGSIDESTVVLSILAGTPLRTLSSNLNVTRTVRSMPNTPAAVKEGITVWMGTPELSESDRQLVAKVLGAFGEEVMVDDEKYLDMATAISGSGPAYVHTAWSKVPSLQAHHRSRGPPACAGLIPLTARGGRSPLGCQREAAGRRSGACPHSADCGASAHLPSQVLLLMESMVDAGVHFGFPRAVATKLVQQTVKGTAIYAMSPEVGQANAT